MVNGDIDWASRTVVQKFTVMMILIPDLIKTMKNERIGLSHNIDKIINLCWL